MATNTCYYDIENVCKPFTPNELNDGDLITLCIFHVNHSISIPFLEYLLYKYSDGKMKDQLIFPFIHYTNKHSLENQLRSFFSKVFQISIQHKGIEIKGICHAQEQRFLFLDISTYIQHVTELDHVMQKNHTDLWWDVIPFEIINTKHIFQFTIHPSVTSLFMQYPNLNYLTNADNTPITQPIIAYNGYSSNRLLFTTVFSKNKSAFAKNERTYKGPFYYYTNYQGSAYYAHYQRHHKNKTMTNKTGCIRTILFMKALTIFANLPNDPIHKLIKKEKGKEKDNNQYDKLRDPYGNWSRTHDSCLMHRPILDDGSILDTRLVMAIKDIEFVISKYWAYYDVKRFPQKWSNNAKYYIE